MFNLLLNKYTILLKLNERVGVVKRTQNKKNWNFASKSILDDIGDNFYNHIETTCFMHISVQYLVKYIAKANAHISLL